MKLNSTKENVTTCEQGFFFFFFETMWARGYLILPYCGVLFRVSTYFESQSRSLAHNRDERNEYKRMNTTKWNKDWIHINE